MENVILEKGTLIEGMQSRYQIIEKIGNGSFANVYKAIQLYTSQIVAIKIPKHSGFESNEYKKRQVKRFEWELDICGKMSHPNIVKLIDRGRFSNKDIFGVFEYIKGNTLKDILLKKGGMRAPVVKDIMSQLLYAIKYMHSKEIVHRDLKPQNIMIEEGAGKVFLLDFGISISLNSRFYDKMSYYEKSGTPAYTIPYHFMGGRVGTYNDIYAWGLILMECFTGYPIIRGRSVNETIGQQLLGIDKEFPFKMFNISLASLLSNIFSKTLSYSMGYESLFRSFFNIDFDSVVYKHGVAGCSYSHSYAEQPTLIINVKY